MIPELESIAVSAAERDFLYDDPVSFRAGVAETLRMLKALLGEPSLAESV